MVVAFFTFQCFLSLNLRFLFWLHYKHGHVSVSQIFGLYLWILSDVLQSLYSEYEIRVLPSQTFSFHSFQYKIVKQIQVTSYS